MSRRQQRLMIRQIDRLDETLEALMTQTTYLLGVAAGIADRLDRLEEKVDHPLMETTLIERRDGDSVSVVPRRLRSTTDRDPGPLGTDDQLTREGR